MNLNKLNDKLIYEHRSLLGQHSGRTLLHHTGAFNLEKFG